MSSGIADWFRALIAPRSDVGNSVRWLPVDERDNGYYNFRLMRFTAGGDLVRYPDHVWSTSTDRGPAGGLRTHLAELARRSGGVLYPDVLLILSSADRRRTLDRGAAWEEQLRALLDKQVERLCDHRGWQLAVPTRSLQLLVVGDGEPAMGGRPLGLADGEFATALLPNLYHGPGPDSHPVADVYIRVPLDAGGPGGFRPVGALYDDQLAFTIGRHWLDNGRDAALPASALYTLHRTPDAGEIGHRLNSDLAGQYRLVHSSNRQGDTITVEDVSTGHPALEVMLIQASGKEQAIHRGEGGPQDTLVPEGAIPGGGMTMIPEREPDPTVVLSRRAQLLQRVHFAGVMQGYHLDVDCDGQAAPQLPDPVARIVVEGDGVRLEVLRGRVLLDGAPPVGKAVPLSGLEHWIETGGGKLVFRSTARGDDPRWPYLGEIALPAEPNELALGSAYRIGRDRRKCEIALPDRAVTENIHWLPMVAQDSTVRTRGGVVPVETFATDSIMVAGRHAEVDLRGNEPRVRALSRVCPVFLRRRNGEVLCLLAKEGATAQPLRQGDDLLVGNTSFRVILPHTPSRPVPATDISPQGGSGAEPGTGAPPAGSAPPSGREARAPREPAACVARALPLPHLGPGGDLSLPASPPRDPSPRPPSPFPPSPLPAATSAGATVTEPELPPSETDHYGDVPRALRGRRSLPAFDLGGASVDESVTLLETR